MKKISELSTDELANVLTIITPEIGEIMENEEVSNVFSQKNVKNDVDVVFGIKRILALVPLLLTKHKESIYKILSAMSNKTIDEIRTQRATETVKELKELLSDEELRNFLS